MQMPPVVNPRETSLGGDTYKSPFNISGFQPMATNMTRISEPTPIADSLVKMCEHSKTSNVKVISDILLQQVDNLAKTDRNYQTNLEISGFCLEKVRFVRGANYLNDMSEIVQKQEKELAL